MTAAPTLPFPTADRAALGVVVRSWLAAHPAGCTDWEITHGLGLPERRHGSVVKRRQEAGAIPTGQTRPSPHGGAPMTVWRLP